MTPRRRRRRRWLRPVAAAALSAAAAAAASVSSSSVVSSSAFFVVGFAPASPPPPGGGGTLRSLGWCRREASSAAAATLAVPTPGANPSWWSSPRVVSRTSWTLCAKKAGGGGGDGRSEWEDEEGGGGGGEKSEGRTQPKKGGGGGGKKKASPQGKKGGGGGQKQKQKKKKGPKKKKGEDGGGGDGGGGNILELIDPFKAGQKLRRAVDQTVETVVTTVAGGGTSAKKKYYLDDRFLEPGEGPAMFAERNPLFDRLSYGEDTLPEVLVVGATGEVGRIVVRRLLLDGRFRVRVLVRDLYSDTLNMLGTGVTYCQGDLSNVESLEYAVTDVDKIVFCAGVPRPDEGDFRRKFEEFTQENLDHHRHGAGGEGGDGTKAAGGGGGGGGAVDAIRDRRDGDDSYLLAAASAGSGPADQSDEEWQRMRSVLEVRSRLAEQIDLVGMQNLIRAYQNVRHADYGTSQAAKRSLFKFQRRPGDFDLFSVEAEEEKKEVEDGNDEEAGGDEKTKRKKKKRRKGGKSGTTAQCGWLRNKFGHGVFVGRVPSGGGEATVVSGRLSSRDRPDEGIDLSAGGFGGFVARLCSDGGRYEAFVRTGDYDEGGIEYVYEFDTGTKRPMSEEGGGGGGRGGNASTNCFVTVRLPFSKFQPVRTDGSPVPSCAGQKTFDGSDVRRIGFRYRSRPASDSLVGALSRAASAAGRGDRYSKFYLSLSYIKVYRTQPAPEFVFVSDARIPPVVRNGMVRHDAKRIVSAAGGEAAVEDSGGSGDGPGEAVSIFDEEEVRRVSEDRDRTDRSGEETYYKYRGEEVLRHSGLSYTIIRIAGYNESPTSQSGSIVLKQSGDDVTPVSRADVAQVCASALLDPEACNTVSYLTKSGEGEVGPGSVFTHILADSLI